MPKANTENSTFAPAKSLSNRRSFMALVTGAAIVATAQRANARPADDSALVKLEEEIFEQYQAAVAFDEEINRLHPIWVGETKRLADDFYAGRSTLTSDERWALVSEMPECRECTRLTNLQSGFFEKMDVLVKEMFATPAHTAEGRRAKATVLLGCIMGDEWRHRDEETEYQERLARTLLIDFIGGEPGEMLRGQFA
jgi:hypothetical protein